MPRAKYHYLQKYALNMLTAAIQRGDLVPAEHCQKCGCPSEGRALDGHHEDYSKPLEVIWLCRSCHKKPISVSNISRSIQRIKSCQVGCCQKSTQCLMDIRSAT